MGRLIPATAAIVAGALLLAWPVALNGYPIVFSDTGALLDMGLLPAMGWDKPFVYGPFLALASLRRSLFGVAFVQTALLSYMLWATQSAFAPPRPLRHLALCLVLAAATAAPWFAVTLLPDAFTAIAALGILTALGTLPRRHTAPVGILTTLAIAAHLSHLVLAAALLAAIALCRLRFPLRAPLPLRPFASLLAALALLLATNLIGNGRLAISPYGSVFALARLIGDGPARTYLAHACPDPAIADTLMLCAWQDRLTDDSDQFLWDPASPFWTDPLPLADFAAQASRIVAATVRTQPGGVLRAAYRNAAREILRVDLGDTLIPDYLADTVRPRIARFFPPAELARYDTSLQAAGTLPPLAARLLPLQRATLLAGTVFCAILLAAGLRHPNPRADFAALVLIALAANAAGTGALSAIHDRYEARLAWLVVLPALLSFNRTLKAPDGESDGGDSQLAFKPPAPARRNPRPSAP